MSVERVVVYDPNDDNPGGGEIAAVIASLGDDAEWMLPEGAEKSRLVAEGVMASPCLARPATDGGVVERAHRIWRRITGPLLFAKLVIRGHTGLAVWIHDPWDGLVLAALSLIVPRRLFFIHNNPRAIRPRHGLASRLEQFVVTRSHVIVHTEALRPAAEMETSHVHVVAHPNYTLSAAARPMYAPVPKRIAFVGGLRSDKGSAELVDLLCATAGGFEFRTVGSGVLSAADIARLRKHQIDYVATGRIDHEKFMKELSQIQLVVAPYTQPTESGSALMCLATGVPMVALDSPTMRRILVDRSLFCGLDDLARGIDDFIAGPWATFRITPAEQEELCRSQMKEALACRYLSP